MLKKALPILVLLSLCATGAFAKNSEALEKTDKKSGKMPVLGGPMPGHVEAKKFLEESTKGPSIKDSVVEEWNALKRRLEKLAEREESERGDPKTGYSKSENRSHSRSAKSPSFRLNLNKPVDLSNWSSASSMYTDGTRITVYYYSPTASNPYNQVKVVYDSMTMEMLSATGYKIMESGSTTPDLTGMDLVSSVYRSDGSLAIERYESTPNEVGTFTQTTVNYDSLGNVSSFTKVLVQPLDLKKIKTLP